MKAARIRISRQALASILGLPEEAVIVSAFQDAQDLAYGNVSLIVHGVGEEVTEGCEPKTASIDELAAQQFDEAMYFPDIHQ